MQYMELPAPMCGGLKVIPSDVWVVESKEQIAIISQVNYCYVWVQGFYLGSKENSIFNYLS